MPAASRSRSKPATVLTVRDNGRGIPVDPHPKFRNLTALEVILTTLHSGGKFGGKVYETSGGLHGVGSSVVNALSESLEVEVARDRVLWRQSYARGKPLTKLVNAGPVQNRRGTLIRFQARPRDLRRRRSSARRGCYRLCRSKAYLFRGVRNPLVLRSGADRGEGRDAGARRCCISPAACATSSPPTSTAPPACCRSGPGRPTCPPAPTASAPAGWNGRSPGLEDGEGFLHSLLQHRARRREGGTHEAGFRSALLKGVRA